MGFGEPSLMSPGDYQVEAEEPVLRLSDYWVCLHVVLNEPPSRPPGPDLDVDSYEYDMLSYAYRVDRPFRCYILVRDKPVQITFPSRIWSLSEGERYEYNLRQEDVNCQAGRRRDLKATVFTTDFVDGLVVVNIALGPSDEPTSDSSFNEYDLIKLAKLWEGGEILSPTMYLGSEDADLSRISSVGPLSETPGAVELDRWATDVLSDLAQTLLGGVSDVALAVTSLPFTTSDSASVRPACLGSLELNATQEQLTEWRASIARVMEGPERSRRSARRPGRRRQAGVQGSPESNAMSTAVALGGILQGLLDFREIDEDELRDVFESDIGGDQLQSRSLLGLHKGSVCSLGGGSRGWATGISPYLALPQAVALHNEVRIRQALQILHKSLLVRPVRARDPWEVSIGEARKRHQEASEYLASYISNVFHYPSERHIYDRVHQTRGLSDLHEVALSKLALARDLVDYREKRNAALFALVGIFLGVITTAEGYVLGKQELLKGPIVIFLAIVVPVFTYAAFYLWARRR